MKTVHIDTNVFIRFFIEDIPDQYQQARELFETIESKETIGLISILVLNEVIWIMEHYYNLRRSLYLPKLMRLLSLPGIRIIETKKDVIVVVFEKMQSTSIDFTDVYLWCIAGNETIVSFDKDFTKIK